MNTLTRLMLGLILIRLCMLGQSIEVSVVVDFFFSMYAVSYIIFGGYFEINTNGNVVRNSTNVTIRQNEESK